MKMKNEDLLKVKNELYETIRNGKYINTDIQCKIATSEIDPTIKELLILIYTTIITYYIEDNTQRIHALGKVIDHVCELDGITENIESELHDVVHSYAQDNGYVEPAPVGVVNTETVYTEPQKWYTNPKNLLIGAVVYVPLVGAVTTLFILAPDEATKATEIIFKLLFQIILPGA